MAFKKYIRTKDNIWETLEEDGISFIVNDIHTPPPFDVYTVLKTEVVKQADTIEELCDEFVIDKKEPFIGILEDLPTLKYLVKLHNKNQKNKWNLYGAIWTNKGLIYVAKMNDKGELELL